jgi:hypothetical protein
MHDPIHDSSSGQSPRDAEMDLLLHQSMAAPIPRLSSDFHQTLSRKLRQNSQAPNKFGRILLAGYAATSVATSILVMRSQGLGWTAIAVTTLAPLALLGLTRRLRTAQSGIATR